MLILEPMRSPNPGGVAEAYAGPGESMRTGLYLFDETCAILTFGGLLTTLYHEKHGVGQKLKRPGRGYRPTNGWTMTTTMATQFNPITGSYKWNTGIPRYSCSFDDQDGRPMVFQLDHRRGKKLCVLWGFGIPFKKRSG